MHNQDAPPAASLTREQILAELFGLDRIIFSCLGVLKDVLDHMYHNIPDQFFHHRDFANVCQHFHFGHPSQV